jgi:hypothetical protein
MRRFVKWIVGGIAVLLFGFLIAAYMALANHSADLEAALAASKAERPLENHPATPTAGDSFRSGMENSEVQNRVLRERIQMLENLSRTYASEIASNASYKSNAVVTTESTSETRPPQNPENQSDGQRTFPRASNGRPTLFSQEQIDAFRCASQLMEVNLASERYAKAHEGFGPPDLNSLAPDISPMTLVCPALSPQTLAYRWEKFDTRAVTYRLEIPNVRWNADGRFFVRCPFHEITVLPLHGAVGVPTKYRAGLP